MISDRARGVAHLTLVIQFALVTALFWGWYSLQPRVPPIESAFYNYLIYNGFLLVGVLVGTTTVRISTGLVRPDFDLASRTAMRQVVGALLYLCLYLVASRTLNISRIFLFTFVPPLYLLLLLTNRLVPPWIAARLYSGRHIEKVLLAGDPKRATRILQWLQQKSDLGFLTIGLVTDEPADTDRRLLPVLGVPQDLERIVREHQVAQVIYAANSHDAERLRHCASVCERYGIRLLVWTPLDTWFGQPIAVYQDQGFFFIGLREEPLQSSFNRLVKRMLDIAVSLPVVVLILPPLMILVWLCQRLQSPGPLFFCQTRPGIGNRPFTIFKFRTLHVGNHDESRLPSANDPRLYPVGRWLRRFSLDEIPQFWNVLRGEMSVVGPRPCLLAHNEMFPRLYSKAYVRSFVKPGITGVAQVRGYRGRLDDPEDVARRIEADIYYLENWSFSLDLWLILRTCTVFVAPPRTAL